jgi:hypothetical protein
MATERPTAATHFSLRWRAASEGCSTNHSTLCLVRGGTKRSVLGGERDGSAPILATASRKRISRKRNSLIERASNRITIGGKPGGAGEQRTSRKLPLLCKLPAREGLRLNASMRGSAGGRSRVQIIRHDTLFDRLRMRGRRPSEQAIEHRQGDDSPETSLFP